MRRLSQMQRAYLMGLRRARAKAQRETDDQADRFEDVIAEIHAEMRGVRDELAKLRTLDHFDTQRDPAKPRPMCAYGFAKEWKLAVLSNPHPIQALWLSLP